MFIGNIGMETDFGFRRIGRLWYNKQHHVASLKLLVFTMNDCVCKPDIDSPPYLEGSIYKGAIPDRVEIGCVNSSENEKGVIYFFRWWAIPIDNNEWLRIQLVDV